tara:strand:+ start:364 stop:600 length:237 start_codon:yes stop_codon:yes gene_type:complete
MVKSNEITVKYTLKVHYFMDEVTITLPSNLAVSLLQFITDNMQVKGKEGAAALMIIIEAFEKGISDIPAPEIDTEADF